MSLLLEQTPNLIGFGDFYLSYPNFSRAFDTAILASNLIIP
jgi:hypothetical protein